jgi:hypothetical protein
MRFITNLLAGLFLTGVLALATPNSFAREGGGGGGGPFGGGGGGHFGGAGHVGGFHGGFGSGGSAAVAHGFYEPMAQGGVVMVRGIMMAVGRITRTTGIPDHLVTGSTTIPAGYDESDSFDVQPAPSNVM